MLFDKIQRSESSVYLNFDSVSFIAMHHHLSSFNIKYTAHQKSKFSQFGSI